MWIAERYIGKSPDINTGALRYAEYMWIPPEPCSFCSSAVYVKTTRIWFALWHYVWGTFAMRMVHTTAGPSAPWLGKKSSGFPFSGSWWLTPQRCAATSTDVPRGPARRRFAWLHKAAPAVKYKRCNPGPCDGNLVSNWATEWRIKYPDSSCFHSDIQNNCISWSFEQDNAITECNTVNLVSTLSAEGENIKALTSALTTWYLSTLPSPLPVPWSILIWNPCLITFSSCLWIMRIKRTLSCHSACTTEHF